MIVNIKIERNPETLRRWNYSEPALVLWDSRRHSAIPLSKVTGDSIRVLLDNWGEENLRAELKAFKEALKEREAKKK